MRLRSLPSLLLLVAAAAMVGIFLFTRPADAPSTPFVVVPSPDLTGPDTALPRLHAAADGALHLTYTGPAPAGSPGPRALYLRTRPAPAAAWSAPRVITATPLLMENWADFPSLTVGTDGQLWVQWFQRNENPDTPGYAGWFARSANGGATWSPPAGLGHEFVSLAPLSGGRVLAVWLESLRIPRAERRPDMATMELRSRLLAPDGATLAAWVVDGDVCNCCQTTLARLPGDEVLVAYRSRRPGEIRDHHTARFNGETWTAPQPLAADGWQIAACPVNGPAAAARGRDVAIAWFTAAAGQPRVRLAFSTDAGRTFGAPLEIDAGHPAGRVDLALLADGTALVTWLENDSAADRDRLLLRRVAPDGRQSAPQLLALVNAERAMGFPRLALTPAEDLVVAYTDILATPRAVRLLSVAGAPRLAAPRLPPPTAKATSTSALIAARLTQVELCAPGP